ncbi:MAG: hypothetical protein HY074_12225 [Deltaproteobacteria bacterium]|nr:hypothetical protein [Deltaproteobacteria bacterium]
MKTSILMSLVATLLLTALPAFASVAHRIEQISHLSCRSKFLLSKDGAQCDF